MFDIKDLPENIDTNNHTWKRKNKFEENGSISWIRPMHLDERDWNRHNIDLKGIENYPCVVIELIHSDDKYKIRVMKTVGSDNNTISEGMGGVIDYENIEKSTSIKDKIQQYAREYDSLEE